MFIGVIRFVFHLRFKKGFESEPTLHSGINYAVLLLAAGHQFDTSFELRKVGEWMLGFVSFSESVDFRLLHLSVKHLAVTSYSAAAVNASSLFLWIGLMHENANECEPKLF